MVALLAEGLIQEIALSPNTEDPRARRNKDSATRL